MFHMLNTIYKVKSNIFTISQGLTVTVTQKVSAQRGKKGRDHIEVQVTSTH